MTKLKSILTAGVLILVFTASAQPGGGGPPGGPPPVPLTGIEYLLISGGLFGAYKMIKRKANKL
jgi:hypothetical protein